ncbi:gluconokinase [Glycomyces albidus]|jgi:gluconokinase|uniref:Gluconokinase n=1 Tax=Glycomyces albidus TaxID=2656774 RepID=A0A6L5GEL7_9ACTN|nr:gluconokinase [Glycomyces albidus]MQM28098.1 AAA family ATPase [Glycomyces albidus]
MATTCLVVMGVSGSGKTTVAHELARRLGWPFAEGDELHTEANIAKMSAGVPLTDADREPWLRRVRDWISAEDAAGRSTVVTCSALKRSYRDLLREAGARVRFVHLDGTRELIAARLAHRSGHFMPPALLDSQFAALEPLGEDEDGIAVDVSDTPEDIATEVIAAFDL